MKMSIERKLTATVVLLSALIAASSAETPTRKCSNGAAKPLLVQIDECYELPCNLPMGVDTHMSIQFVATKDSMTSLSSDVHLTVLGTKIPIILEEAQRNVCDNLLFGAYCPLDTEEDVTYHLIVPIADTLPEVPSKLEVSIIDNTDGSVVSCFLVDTRLKRSL